MNAVTYDVAYTDPRNRLTTAFRYILVIPHMLIVGVWGYLAQLLAVAQWFVILFTGQRHEGIFNLQNAWLAYAARVSGYEFLLFDPWPNIGTEPRDEPTSYRFDYAPEANRLTNALRLLWIIPALIISILIGIASIFVTIVSWFAILFTGTHPRGMFDFLLRSVRFSVRVNAYGLLMTDDYPKFDGSEPTGVVGSGAPLPAPAGPRIG